VRTLEAAATPSFAACQSQPVGLLRPIAAQTGITLQLSADGRFVTTQHLCHLALGMPGSLKNVNLMSFFLGKLRVATHLRLSYFGRLEKTGCYRSFPSNRSVRVALQSRIQDS
jgi:hypothetical protein